MVARHELPALDTLKAVPFIRRLRYTPARGPADRGYDGQLDLRTPAGQFRLLVETKRSFLTHSVISHLLAWRQQLGKRERVILFARHIPRLVADRLIDARINFVDDAGNVHLVLGDHYNWTVVGKPALESASDQRPISSAQLQLLFQFATQPESVTWPVRRLETPAGISKSTAAQVRRQLVAEGLLLRKGKLYQLGPASLVKERLVSGYAQVLRPKLLLGQFRAQEKTVGAFMERLRRGIPSGIRYALTGAPAADLLQHFYRGPEVPMFVQPASRQVVNKLRLLPDRDGPITVLRAFGQVVFWEERAHHVLAPPWLIYAELRCSNDPRAYEAARELETAFLG